MITGRIQMQTPRTALNKAFLRQKPTRNEIDKFKINFGLLLERIDHTESEEFHKNLVVAFLKKTSTQNIHLQPPSRK